MYILLDNTIVNPYWLKAQTLLKQWIGHVNYIKGHLYSLTHPRQSKVHLQFGHSSPYASPDPDSKWDGAVRVVLETWCPPQPALRNESFSIWKLVLIVTHCIVTQMELRLKWTTVKAYAKGLLSKCLWSRLQIEFLYSFTCFGNQ